MNDFYFENELMNRIRKENYDSLQMDFEESLEKIKSGVMPNFKRKVDDMLTIVDIYVESKYGENAGKYYHEESDKFQEAFTEESIAEFAKNYSFTEDECLFVKLGTIKNSFLTLENILDILLNAKLVEYFGKECLTELIENHKDLFIRYKVNIPKYNQLLSNRPFGENLESILAEEVENAAENDFNFKINCGGYALKIDKCVFPDGKNFSQSVTRILEEFPFTRLLGNTTLSDDEYLVIYRANDDGNGGHHFIRVDSDGVVREKDASNPVQIFEAWPEVMKQSNSKEAIFAVKKEHPMFNVKDIFQRGKEYDFSESVDKALKEKTNAFNYHCHDFRLKKNDDGDIIIIDEKGEFIAFVIAEDEKCLVEVADDKVEYVENNRAKADPIIKDGVLLNYSEITGRRILKKDDEECMH